jgi:GNAT superfamily N-acetyltransferase
MRGLAGRRIALPPGSVPAVSGDVEVRPVQGRRELTSFIKLPFRLHEGTVWVPPLVTERRQFLNRSKNPFFEHAEAEYFLAWRDARPVGRITAQIDERWDRYQGGSDGMFGFFESEDDPEIAAALLNAASGWVRGRGRERLLGPMDFTTNDECGLLVEGYERPPLILQPWHPPYYAELIEGQGLIKSMDLLMWWLELGGQMYSAEGFHPMIHEVARKVSTEHGVKIRDFRKKDIQAEITRFIEVYNSAWEKNWGFVPITEEEVRAQASNLKPVLDERWGFIAERDGEVLGAALTLPDVNQVLKRMDGSLLPFGWLTFLRATYSRMGVNTPRAGIDRVRVFALGVKPEYQHLGIAAAFYVRCLDVARALNQTRGETGWILEVNKPMNRAMEGMGGKVVKRYRLYERAT